MDVGIAIHAQQEGSVGQLTPHAPAVLQMADVEGATTSWWLFLRGYYMTLLCFFRNSFE